MTYAVVTVELPDNDNLWQQFLTTASRHAGIEKINEYLLQNRWLLDLKKDVRLFSSLVVTAESKGLSYDIHIFDSDPLVISKNL